MKVSEAIATLHAAKEELEADLAALISERLLQFHETHGLMASEVDVNLNFIQWVDFSKAKPGSTFDRLIVSTKFDLL